MNFSIAQIIARLCAPQHEISCSWFLWQRLCARLRERGRNATRESGAFLLGYRTNGRARVTDFILYDDLDPRTLDTGIVHFDGRYFGALWDICKQRSISNGQNKEIFTAGPVSFFFTVDIATRCARIPPFFQGK